MNLRNVKSISICLALLLPLVCSGKFSAGHAITLPVCSLLSMKNSQEDGVDSAAVSQEDEHPDEHGHKHEGGHVHEEEEHDPENRHDRRMEERLELIEIGNELELAMIESELHAKRLEQHRIELSATYELAVDRKKTSTFAIMQACEILDERDAFDLLTDCLAESNDDLLKRVLRLKLAQLAAETDRIEMAKQHLKALILEK